MFFILAGLHQVQGRKQHPDLAKGLVAGSQVKYWQRVPHRRAGDHRAKQRGHCRICEQQLSLCQNIPQSPSRAAVPEHCSCGYCQDSPHLVASFACHQAEPKAFNLFSSHIARSSSLDCTRSPSAAGTGASTSLQTKCAIQHNCKQMCQGLFQLAVPPETNFHLSSGRQG